MLRTNLSPAEAELRCKARKKWQPYTYINGISVSCLQWEHCAVVMRSCIRKLLHGTQPSTCSH